MTINALKERRTQITDRMTVINRAASDDNRDLTDAERREFESLNNEGKNVSDRIDREEKVAAMERNADAAPDTMWNETRNYSFAKAIREHTAGKMTGVEAEYDQHYSRGRNSRGGFCAPMDKLSERRDLTTATHGGGNLIATGLAPLQDRFRSMLKVVNNGATIMSGLTGNLDLPNIESSGNANWVVEGENATRSNMSFKKIGLTPKTVSGEYAVSRRMLLQSDTALESVFRNDLGYILAQALDSAAISGGGANEPIGLLSHSDVLKVDGYASPSDLSDLTADMIAALEIDDVTGTAAFLSNPHVANIARKLKDADGRNIPLSELFHNERLEITTQVPNTIGATGDKSALIYGQWSNLVIGYWSAVDIVVNPYHAEVASNGGALIHAFLDCDIAVRQPQAFRYAEI